MVDQAIAMAAALDKLEDKLAAAKKKATMEKDAEQKKKREKEVHATSADKKAMQTNYDNSIFQVAVTLAHELCHLFTGFLTGSDRPRTPENVTVPGQGTEMSGEHGWAWEYKVLGGCTQFVFDPKLAKASLETLQLQSGTPFIHDGVPGLENRVWYEYKPGFMTGIVNFREFPGPPPHLIVSDIREYLY